MKPSGPHLTLEIKGEVSPGAERIPGEEIHAMFARAEGLVERACQDSLFWVFADGTQQELNPQQLIRVDFEPTPYSVRLHVSVPGRNLAPQVQPEAQKIVQVLKSSWSARVRIFVARLLGVDIEQADQANVDRVASDLQALVSGWVLHTVGYRLGLLLAETGLSSSGHQDAQGSGSP